MQIYYCTDLLLCEFYHATNHPDYSAFSYQIMKIIAGSWEIQFGGLNISFLLYADDVILLVTFSSHRSSDSNQHVQI